MYNYYFFKVYSQTFFNFNSSVTFSTLNNQMHIDLTLILTMLSIKIYTLTEKWQKTYILNEEIVMQITTSKLSCSSKLFVQYIPEWKANCSLACPVLASQIIVVWKWDIRKERVRNLISRIRTRMKCKLLCSIPRTSIPYYCRLKNQSGHF